MTVPADPNQPIEYITSSTISSANVSGTGVYGVSLIGSSPPLVVPLTCGQSGGHAVANTVRYVDGLIVGCCEVCGDRVTIRVPGGAHVPEAESLASAAMDMAKNGHAAEALALLELFGTALQTDATALAQALSIFETVKAGISRILQAGP